MGLYLNPGTELFEDALRSPIYVDKTELLRYTNSLVRTKERYLAVSRPRRFGKTTTLDMLSAYYGRTYNSEKIFAPLKIAGDESFKDHLNKYNVIQLNMLDYCTEAGDVDGMIDGIATDVLFELQEAYPDVHLSERMPLYKNLGRSYAATKIPFIFLIDEWDALFRVDFGKRNGDEQKKYLDYLRQLLKDKPYVALAYMTGILPIKKYGEHSALNMFAEYSMTEAVPISEFTEVTVEGGWEDIVSALLVGIAYDRQTKKHSCLIEEMEKG